MSWSRFLSICLLFLAAIPARADITFNILDSTATGVGPLLVALKAKEVGLGNNTAAWPWSVRLADFNGDGKPDCYITYHNSVGYGGLILRGNGDGTFTSYPGQPDNRSLPSGATPWLRDWDGDGTIDLGHFAESSYQRCFKNIGGVFSRTSQSLSGNYGEFYGNPVYVEDLNSDGKLDLRILLRNFGRVKQFTRINQGNWSFTTTTTNPAPRPPGLPATIIAELDTLADPLNPINTGSSPPNRYAGPVFWLGDLNGDGRPDVVIQYRVGYATNPAQHFGRYLLRNAAGDLEDKSSTFPMAGAPDLPPVDYNGDGRLDIITTHSAANTSGLWLQQADGTFVNSSPAIRDFVKPNVAYAYVIRGGVDFDQDGKPDLVISNARAGVFKILAGTGADFIEKVTGKHWDGTPAVDIGDVNGDGLPDVVVGGPGPGNYAGGIQSDTNFTCYLNTSVAPMPPPPPPPPPPPEGRIPAPPNDPSSPQFGRFKAAVDGAMSGRPYYEYKGWHAALAYKITREAKYATEAVRMAEAVVAKAEADIAAGNPPDMAGDQYLGVGAAVMDLAKVYDWCGSFLTPAQRTRIESLCDQACANIWNPPGATWGGKPHPWPGWSVDNPGNNYHFSFLEASMNWGIAADRQPLLTQLKTVQLPNLLKYYRTLPDGGSREGTGYGDAQHTLFQNTNLWRAATQTDPFRSPFFTRGSSYWIHATLPNMRQLANIGDQARDHDAFLFDYHRDLALQAVQFSDPVTASHLRWWLGNITHRQMSHAFNYPYELLPVSGIIAAPTKMHYFAPELGHYFWRREWAADSPWLGFIAGPYLEAHASQDQGSFQLFRNRWLVAPANLQSTSGIMQATPYQSVVRFTRNGSTIPQRLGTKPAFVTAAATANGVEYAADLSPFYTGIKWTRRLTFDGTRLVIDDDVETPADVVATWQAILPAQPAVDASTATVPGMAIELGVPVGMYDLRNEPIDANTGNRFTGGYRVEAPITGSHRAVITLQ